MSEAKGRKSIFITGGASGIGAETARLFSRKGWFCGLFDINEAGLADVAAEIGSENCMYATLDVCNREDWARAIAQFGEATEGRMNVLFNNAGIGRHGWFEDIPPEDADAIVSVNLNGVINGIYAALDMLKQTPGARIVNTASAAGLVGSPQLSVYSATKFAVRGLTEALDVEFSGLDIRVTTLMPWVIDTPILQMGATEGANHSLADDIRASGSAIYPVSLAAERAWDAAHGKDVHYLVGKRAEQAGFAQRFIPKRLRKGMAKRLPARG